MAKVQFNCRLESDISEWITTEAAIQTAKRGSKFSQADVVSLLVNEEQNAREVRAMKSTAHMRPGSVSQPRTFLDATGPKASEGRGKASIQAWTRPMRQKGDKGR